MNGKGHGLRARWDEVWLVECVGAPFDETGALAPVSPVDLGINAGRKVLARSGLAAEEAVDPPRAAV